MSANNQVFNNLIKTFPKHVLEKYPYLDYKPSIIVLDSNIIIRLESYYDHPYNPSLQETFNLVTAVLDRYSQVEVNINWAVVETRWQWNKKTQLLQFPEINEVRKREYKVWQVLARLGVSFPSSSQIDINNIHTQTLLRYLLPSYIILLKLRLLMDKVDLTKGIRNTLKIYELFINWVSLLPLVVGYEVAIATDYIFNKFFDSSPRGLIRSFLKVDRKEKDLLQAIWGAANDLNMLRILDQG